MIDLDKLSPALERPQRALAKRPDTRLFLLGDVAEVVTFCSQSAAAFDVMMRRGWSVVPLDRCKGGLWWTVRTKRGFDMPLLFIVGNEHRGEFSDPFTALVTADAWMKEQEALR